MEAPAFLEDIYPHHLLYAVTIRSPIAKGFVKFIIYPKLPANYYIITARNIPGKNRLEETVPVLADSRLSYIGEPVALLLGQDKTKLEEFASQCKVVVDEEKAVFSCVEASGNAEEEPAAVRLIQTGVPGQAFVETGKIVTGSYVTEIQDHWYAEPAGAVTWFEKDNEKKEPKSKKSDKVVDRCLIVKTATQWPYHVKRSVASVLGIEQSAVSVEPTSLNLHMDGKLTFVSLVACHAALGTFITKRPVRLILNREEDFLYSPKRCKANIDIASNIDENGNIIATEIEIAVNSGAYGVNAQEILDQICLGTLGFYDFDNLLLTARAEKTNIPPQGPFSGFGLAQGFFAMERHVSQIADVLNKDPSEWRKERADSTLLLPSGASTKNHISAEELIGEAAKMSDYYRKWASYEMLRQIRKGKPILAEKEENPRGIGIALGFQGNGLLYSGEDTGYYSVDVTLTKESILEIRTSITSSDEDLGKIWARLAAEILSIEPSMVRVIALQAPDCGPSCASRNITVITKLVEKCCNAIRKQRFHDPLPITVRRSVRPQSGSLWNGRFAPPEGKVLDINGFSKPGMAAAVVEVVIDLIECIPKIRGVWLGISGGRIISKNRARRSLTRGAVQALGWAFTENVAYSNGILPLEQYNNYTIPIPDQIPPININFLSDDSGEPRGIGELPFTCIPAAFIQAVSQAVDHCFKTVPLKRKEIWDIVRLRNAETHLQGTK